MNIGEKLKLVREKQGFTQSKLAEISGYSRNSIINWEQGKRSPTYEMLAKLASALGVTTDELIGRTSFADATNEDTKKEPARKDELKVKKRRIDTDLIDVPVVSREWTACCGNGLPALDLSSEDGQVISIPRASLRIYDDMHPPFAIYCEGDCLESDGIFNGDTVVINPAEEPLNGATALVSIAGSLSLKHVFTLRNGDVILKSDQGERRLSPEQQDSDEFVVCGAMVCSIRRPRVWTL